MLKATLKSILFLVFFIAISSSSGFGENIYISQTTNGTGSGVDCADANSASWFNSPGSWANPKQSGLIGPGDTVHLCGTLNTELSTNANGNAGYPITILFEKGAAFSIATWASYTGAIEVKNNYITVDGGTNGLIKATDNGTGPSFSNGTSSGAMDYSNYIYGVYIHGASNVTVKDLNISGLYARLALSNDSLPNSFGFGDIQIDGNSNNITIANNTLSDAMFGVYDILTDTSNVMVSNNTIANTSTGVNIAPGNTSTTGSNISVTGNTITGGAEWDGSWGDGQWFHQDGLHFFSQDGGLPVAGWIDGLIISNNYLQDFGTHSTAHIYVEGQGMQNVLIYNNVCVDTGSNYAANGMITIKKADNTKIYNNTLLGAGTSDNIGIYLNGLNGIYVQNADIKNNIIENVRTIMAWQVGSTWTSDYNDFYSYDPLYMFEDSNNAWYTLSWWKGQGCDLHGLGINPGLASNLVPNASSPLGITAGGVNLDAVFTSDKRGVARSLDFGWSMGAYEGKRPSPPTNLH